ncbi:MAG: hypothetical protein HC853_04435 [Anaerolineae bacterium]|nr:hypothetical protein [Anaerolineae bacterium]
MSKNESLETYDLAGFSDNGIAQPHFVNGYNLSADELLLQAQATATRAKNLAQAAGHGVARGLMVTVDAKQTHLVQIDKGLGVTTGGQLILLKQAAQLDLKSVKLLTQLSTDQSATANAAAATDTTQDALPKTTFGPCNATGGSTPGTSSTEFGPNLKAGVYVLVAKSEACLDGTKSQRYNSSPLTHDGVSFRLLALCADANPTDEEAKQLETLYRNRLAYLFFGDAGQVTARERAIPFGPPSAADPPTAPFCKAWKDDVLPLAVIVWRGSTVVLIENWSVRRRMVHPNPAQYWEPLIGDGGAAEGQARFVQFKAHLADLAGKLSGPSAAEVFRWMPPAGYLPALISQMLRVRLGRYIVQMLGDGLLGLKAAEAKPIQDALQEIAFPLVEFQAKALKADEKQTLLDVEKFFAGHLLIHRLGTLDTAHHVLHRSWYDAPLNTQTRQPIIIYTLIDPLLGLFWHGLDLLMTGKITDDTLLKTVSKHVEILKKYWERPTGSPNPSLQELTRVQIEMTSQTAYAALPFVVYVRAEPEDLPYAFTPPDGSELGGKRERVKPIDTKRIRKVPGKP